jgi:hypothetical protein
MRHVRVTVTNEWGTSITMTINKSIDEPDTFSFRQGADDPLHQRGEMDIYAWKALPALLKDANIIRDKIQAHFDYTGSG